MSEKKPELPFGWIVKQSKSYPDRVYYFNVNTGASTWEFPDLIQPLQAKKSTSAATSPSVLIPSSVDPRIRPSSREPSNTYSSSEIRESSNTYSSSEIREPSNTYSSSEIREPSNTYSSTEIRESHPIQQHIPACLPPPPPCLKPPLLSTPRNVLPILSDIVSWDPTKGTRIQVKNVDTDTISAAAAFVDAGRHNVERYGSRASDGHSDRHSRKKQYKKNNGSLAQAESLTTPSKLKRARTNSDSKQGSDSVSRDGITSPDFKRRRGSSPPVTDLRDKLKRKHETENRQSTRSGKNVKKKHSSSSEDTQKHGMTGRIYRPETSVYRHVTVNKTTTPVKTDIIAEDQRSDTDQRKVVKSLRQELVAKRSIKVKSGSADNVRPGSSCPDTELVVSTSGVGTPPNNEPANEEEDTNNNTKAKMFIGSTDKLLSIQSWIENLQEGSDSPVPDSYGQMGKFDNDLTTFDKSTDSGYSSLISPKIRTERGWPGELRLPRHDEREIVEMEVDNWELPEYTDTQQFQEAMDIDPILIQAREEVKANPNPSCVFNVPQQAEIKKGLLVVIDTNILIAKLNFLEDLRDHEVKGLGKPVLYIPWMVLQELDYLKDKVSTKKSNAGTQVKACKAVSFLKSQFANRHPRVIGQSPKQADEAAMEFSACCNDDVILQASLYCQKQYPATHVVLLTNDINLTNKAIVSNVKAFNSSEILEGVKKLPVKTHVPVHPPTTLYSSPTVTMAAASTSVSTTATLCSAQSPPAARPPAQPLCVITSPQQTPHTTVTSPHKPDCDSMRMKENQPQHVPTAVNQSADQPSCTTVKLLQEQKHYTEETLADDVMCKLKRVLKEAMGRVLEVEMKAAYDDIWLDIVYRKPPWSLRDILDCWKKHWMAVFGFVFTRRLERNITDIRDNLFKVKGPTLQDMGTVCDKSLPILHECVQQKKYGETMCDITACVVAIQRLCEEVGGDKLPLQSVSSLDAYLKSMLDPSKSKYHPPHSSTAQSKVHTTTVLSGTDQSHTLVKHSDTQSADQTTSRGRVKSHDTVSASARSHDPISSSAMSHDPITSSGKSCDPISSSRTSHDQISSSCKSRDQVSSSVKSHDQISSSVVSHAPDSTSVVSHDLVSSSVMSHDHVTDNFGSCDPMLNSSANQQPVLTSGTNQQWASAEDSVVCVEAAAGELLQNIWELIYKCCDHIYQELNGSPSVDTKQQVEGQLQRLVPAAKQLRVLYTSLLEIDVSELHQHEDKFTALCDLCNNFFNMLQIQENIPEVPVTTTQFLVLFSSPQHRPTLDEFQEKLDAMLRHLYGCLNILYPDH